MSQQLLNHFSISASFNAVVLPVCCDCWATCGGCLIHVAICTKEVGFYTIFQIRPHWDSIATC